MYVERTWAISPRLTLTMEVKSVGLGEQQRDSFTHIRVCPLSPKLLFRAYCHIPLSRVLCAVVFGCTPQYKMVLVFKKKKQKRGIKKKYGFGTSLPLQWPRLCDLEAEGPGLIPGQGTRAF